MKMIKTITNNLNIWFNTEYHIDYIQRINLKHNIGGIIKSDTDGLGYYIELNENQLSKFLYFIDKDISIFITKNNIKQYCRDKLQEAGNNVFGW